MALEFNQLEVENKWQKKWKEDTVFEPKVDSSKEKFMGNVAYPYANSVLHIGHGRTYTIADTYLRYQRVLGKNVMQALGFHISGTPVLAVADGIKRGDVKVINQVKDAISDYVQDPKEQDELIETFYKPENIAEFFASKIEGALDSIGVGIDWSRKFTTGEPIYNKFIEWQYSKLKQRGLLKQGKYPILYSVDDENAVGEDDIKDGDTNKVSVSFMTGIKFQVKGTQDFVICATLRPDALFCATNLWQKEDMNLVKLKVGDENWIVSKAAQVKIEHQFENVELIEEFTGKDLIGKIVIAPIVERELPVYKANFCDENHGTGIVYSSPADSPHDYLNLFQTKFPGETLDTYLDVEPLNLTPITKTYDKKGNEISYKFNIPAYDILMKYGIYKEEGNEEKLENIKQELYKEAHFGAKMINSGEFDGLPLKNNVASEKVKAKLFDLNRAFNFYETSRRAKTRGGGEVIVANLQGQWFLDYSDRDVKDQAIELLDNAKFYPGNLKPTQKGYIEWANMRPCARKRGLGTALPYDQNWIIEPLSDSTIYQMLYMISSLIREYNVESEKLTFEFFDYVYLGNGSIDKVVDMTGLEREFVERAKEETTYWNGVDFRYVGLPHMSNHLNFLIYHYSLIFPQDKWPKMMVAGNFMMKDGEKISKSKGNGIPLYRMKKVYGADLYRLYIATNSNYDVEMDFRDEEVKQLEKKFDRWKSLLGETKDVSMRSYGDFSTTNKWLISKFYSRAKDYFTFFEDFRVREAFVTILYEFLNDINYHERRTGEQETLEVLKFIAKDYLILMTPAVPHICEELWEYIGGEGYVSHASFTTELGDYIAKEVEDIESIAQELLAVVSRAREQNKLSSVSKITLIQAPNKRFELFDRLSSLLENKAAPKEIFSILQGEFPEDKKFIGKFVPKTLGGGLSSYLPVDDEHNFLVEFSKYLEKEFSCNVIIEQASGLTVSAIPGKPAVKVE